MLTGLSAFPLTPLDEGALDEAAFTGLVERLAASAVDSVAVLGSTGSYAYLTRAERARITELAVQHAGDKPVVVGIGALATGHVQELAEDAQRLGASGVLLAPMTYQPLTAEDVLGLYEDVTRSLSVPLVVYDNPTTTGVTFTDELYAAVAALPNVASLKIPGVPDDPGAAADRVRTLRGLVPATVTVGVSGDRYGAAGLLAGCDAWYSAVAGTLPGLAVPIVRAAATGDAATAGALSRRLEPLWELFAAHGSVRVIAAIAEHLGLARRSSLPLPVRGLGDAARARLVRVLEELEVAA